MPRGQKYVPLLQLGAGRMIATHGQRIAIGVEPLPVKSAERIADRDHEIDGAGELGGEDGRTAPRHHVDPDIRRVFRDLFHQ